MTQGNDGQGQGQVVVVHERGEVAALALGNPPVHVHGLGDLDNFTWPHTARYGWPVQGELAPLALVYTRPHPPALLAYPDGPAAMRRDFLRALATEAAQGGAA